MEEKRFATVMWGGFDFIADAGGNDPDRREWLMECSGLQASSSHIQQEVSFEGSHESSPTFVAICTGSKAVCGQCNDHTIARR